MIERVQLVNFKGHAHTSLTLQPLTLLVGPNGSGKSSVLHALQLLARLHEDPRLSRGLDAELSALIRRDDAINKLELGAQGQQDHQTRSLHFGVERRVAGMGGVEPKGWRSELRFGPNGPNYVVDTNHNPAVSVTGSSSPARHWPDLADAELLRLDPRRIAQIQPPTAEQPELGPDGAGTAEVIAALLLNDPERVEAIVAALQTLVPQVRRVGIQQKRLQDGPIGYQLALDFVGARKVPASGVSEGTLLALALVTRLQMAKRPRLLLLDDLEAGLHPSAQQRVMTMLRALTEGGDPVQVVATTHSPFVIDGVEPEAAQVFALREDGSVATKPLSAHPDAAAWRGKLSAGQLWTLDDEQVWVTLPDRA